MTVITKALIGLGGTATTGAIGFGTYEIVRPKSIAETLTFKGKTILDVSGDTDSGIWEKLHGKYSTNTADNFSNPNPAISDKDTLKNHCKTVLEKKSSENEDDLKKAEKWCTKESEHAQ